MDDDVDVNRKLNIYKHRKKQAANDAQLLMNRIALLQKEEERARKKIDQTKDRAMEILMMRAENEKRTEAYIRAVDEDMSFQRELQVRNKEADQYSRKARADLRQNLYIKRKEDATELQQEKRQLTKVMLKEQAKDLRLKQKKAEEVRKKEEEARLRREREKEEYDRKVREAFEKKAAEEETEARKAERLVKALEKKEREWMMKLRATQDVQERAFEQLEGALLGDAANLLPERGSPTGKLGSGSVSSRGSRGGIDGVGVAESFGMMSVDSGSALGPSKVGARVAAGGGGSRPPVPAAGPGRPSSISRAPPSGSGAGGGANGAARSSSSRPNAHRSAGGNGAGTGADVGTGSSSSQQKRPISRPRGTSH